MLRWARYPLQLLAYAAFIALLGWLSQRPSYTYLAPNRAVIKLSVDQYGHRIGKCRKLTAAELAALPAYQRLPTVCPRRRYPVKVSVSLDGHLLYEKTRSPAGLRHDGLSYIYARFVVPAGPHRVEASLWDNGPSGEPTYRDATAVTLRPTQIFVIEFSAQHRVFVFR